MTEVEKLIKTLCDKIDSLNDQVNNLANEKAFLESELSSAENSLNISENSLKDAAGEIELYQRENAEVKAENKMLKNQNNMLTTFCESCKKLEVQKEINKNQVDTIDKLKNFVRSCMKEESKYTMEECRKLLELPEI